MPKLLLKYLLALLLTFSLVDSYAQKKVAEDKAIVIKIDSSKIEAAKFDKDAIGKLKDQRDFQYDEQKAEPVTLWDRFWNWFWYQISRLFMGAASNSTSRYFFIGLGVALLLFILIKIIGAENIFSKKSKETILPYDVLTENIHEIDFEAEINRLIKEQKYRLAVRLLYLNALKKLSDADIINWQPDKTNYNYLTEINQPELKSKFSKLTLQFDYIWYGDFPVDEQKFEPINHSFKQFNTQLNERL